MRRARPMRGFGATAWGLGFAVLCAAGAAEARGSLEVSWKAPADCPQEGEFKRQLEHFLGQSVESQRDQDIVILAVTTRTDATTFSVRLSIATARGLQRRELTHRDCGELTEAAALVAALAVDPTLTVPPPADPPPAEEALPSPPAAETTAPVEAPPPEPPPASPPAPPPTSPAPVPRDAAPESNQESSGLPLSLALLGFVGTGALPEVGTGVAGQLGASFGSFRLMARGSYWFPSFAEIKGMSGPGVELDLWSAGLRGCGVWRSGRFELAGCLGPEVGDLRGKGVDVQNTRTRHARLSALMVEGTIAYQPRPGTMALLGFELGKTLESPPFGIVQDGDSVEAFEPSPFIARALLGLGVL